MFALTQLARGAAARHPRQLGSTHAANVEAVLNFLKALCVTFAPPRLVIQQFAGHSGVEHIGRPIIDQLVKTALPAAIAQ